MKNSNGTGTNNGKKITDFFLSSQSNSNGRTNPSGVDVSYSSVHPRALGTQTRDSEDRPTLRKSSRLSRTTTKAQSSATAASKRGRSPDVVSPRSKNVGGNESRSKLTKRQKKFESDSDVDMANCAPVIHVKQQGRRGNVKRTFPDEKLNDERFESVPTSQSDEMELDTTSSVNRNPPEMKRRIGKGLQESGNHSTLPNITAPLSSSPSLSVPSTPTSLHSGYSNGADANPDTSMADALTPPISEHLPTLPTSPLPLGQIAKTALLIEKIKAEAHAKVHQLEDSPPPEFNEVLDSSSDDEEMQFVITLDARGRKSAEKEPPVIASPSDQERCYAFRGPKPRISRASLSPSSRRNSLPTKAPAREKDNHGKALNNSTIVPNPLDALLSEKRKLEKAGKDAKALLQAETMLQFKETLFNDDTDRDGASEKWSDEIAARNVVQEVLAKDRAEFEESSFMDISLGADETAGLIGANAGKVADILKKDRANEEQDIHVDGVRGVRLWTATSRLGPIGDPPQGYQSHSLQYCGVNPTVRLLKTALDQQDHTQASLIMESGVLCSVDLRDCGNLILLLCEQAFSYPPRALKSSAFLALASIYSKHILNTPPFSVMWLHRVFASLGAEPTILEQMGYRPCSANEGFPSAEYQTDSILRLIHVIQLAAQSQLVETSHIPDLILTLLLVALDPSTYHELQHDITRLVDVLCNLATADTESCIREKAISFNMTLELPYRAQFASVFSCGSGAARRIARWVAYSALVDHPPSCQHISMDVPPLQELLDVIEFGDIFRIRDDSDYNILWHAIRIMSIALTDIELYNAAESHDSRAQSEQFGSSTKHRNKHPLILTHEALERLHAEIQDTRALHLDRSRVKAAIKQLSLRLRYQRTDSAHDHVHQAGMPRRRTLDQFFSPKKREL